MSALNADAERLAPLLKMDHVLKISKVNWQLKDPKYGSSTTSKVEFKADHNTQVKEDELIQDTLSIPQDAGLNYPE